MATEELNLMDDYRPPPLPEDFGRRLEGLKKLTNLRWQEFAGRLGVTDRGVLLWRRGHRQPSRTSYQAIMDLARDLPGGYELMTRDGDEAEVEAETQAKADPGEQESQDGDGGDAGHD